MGYGLNDKPTTPRPGTPPAQPLSRPDSRKVKSCMTCKWVACRNYGWDRQPCMSYIPEHH